jgi:nitroreductase
VDSALAGEWADALIHGRRTVLPKRLVAPGPDAAQLQRILGAAAAAPDHGELIPWRFVLIPEAARSALADVFAASLRARDEQATDEQLTQARDKAFRAPLLLLAVANLGAPADDIPPGERILSAGCAIQNMLLMATALGFGSALTSGKALGSPLLRSLFALAEAEQALCFVSMGTIAGARRARVRPGVERYVSELQVLR